MKVKFYFEYKRLALLSVLSIFTGLIYSFSTDIINKTSSVSSSFEAIVGYNDFFEYGLANLQGVIILFILSLPTINYYEKNLSKVNAYIFSRIKSKSKYFLTKFLYLCLFDLISSAFYFMSKMFFDKNFIISKNMALCFVNFFLALVIFSSFVCLMSVFIGCTRSYLIMVVIYCVLIFLVTTCYYNCNNISVWMLILLNPCARFMINWNGEYLQILSEFQTKMMLPVVSIIYFAVLVLVSIFILIFTTNKYDISFKLYDEE